MSNNHPPIPNKNSTSITSTSKPNENEIESKSPLLTIAIPTYNREKYLSELIQEIIIQIKRIQNFKIEVLVIDNASTDKTGQIFCKEYEFLKYKRNKTNIGGDRNFIECIKSATGKYLWLFGDDEVLRPGGIERVATALKDNPSLVIAESSFENNIQADSYRNLLIQVADIDPIFPLHQTLITRNVFPREKFNLPLAENKLETNYAHIYGLIPHLTEASSILVLSKTNSAFQVRDVRAEFAVSPVNLERKLVDLNRHIAKEINYPRLGIDIWLYYNSQPIYRLRKSRKFKRFMNFFGF